MRGTAITDPRPPVPARSLGGRLAGGVGTGGGLPVTVPGRVAGRVVERRRARRRHAGMKRSLVEAGSVVARPMPAAPRARLTQVNPPIRGRPEAVQVVARRPRLVPRLPGRRVGPLREHSRITRPTTPAACTRPVRAGAVVATENLLRITPQQAVDDVQWFGLANSDHFPYPTFVRRAGNLRTER